MSTGPAELESDPDAWDAFLRASATPSHLQSSGWAETKRPNGWRPFRVAVDVGGRIVGTERIDHRRQIGGAGAPVGVGIGPGEGREQPLNVVGDPRLVSARRLSARDEAGGECVDHPQFGFAQESLRWGKVERPCPTRTPREVNSASGYCGCAKYACVRGQYTSVMRSAFAARNSCSSVCK